MDTVGWLTIKEQVQVATLIQTWKLINNLRPPRLLDRLTVTPDRLIETGRPRLQFSQSCYRWKSAELWNELDSGIRNELSLAKFKKLVRKNILENRSVLAPAPPPAPPD